MIAKIEPESTSSTPAGSGCEQGLVVRLRKGWTPFAEEISELMAEAADRIEMREQLDRMERMLVILTAPTVRCEDTGWKCEYNHQYGASHGHLCPTHKRHFSSHKQADSPEGSETALAQLQIMRNIPITHSTKYENE